MSRIPETNPDSRLDLDDPISFNRRKISQACLRIVHRVQRFDIFFPLPSVFSSLPLGIHLLDMGGIPEHYLTQFSRRRRCNDFTPESIPDQFGNSPAVINVGMGQDQGINFSRIIAPVFPVTTLHLLSALE